MASQALNEGRYTQDHHILMEMTTTVVKVKQIFIWLIVLAEYAGKGHELLTMVVASIKLHTPIKMGWSGNERRQIKCKSYECIALCS